MCFRGKVRHSRSGRQVAKFATQWSVTGQSGQQHRYSAHGMPSGVSVKPVKAIGLLD